jgi:hypothetical protein
MNSGQLEHSPLTNNNQRAMLDRVHKANVREAQIGGLTDGISPEVASDLGYDPEYDFETTEAGAAALRVAIDKLAQPHLEKAQTPVEEGPIKRPLLKRDNRQPTIAEQRRNARKAEAQHLKLVYGQEGDADQPRYRRLYRPGRE